MDATHYCEYNSESEFAVVGGGYTDLNGNAIPSYKPPAAHASELAKPGWNRGGHVKAPSGGGDRIACRMIKADCGRWSGIYESRLR